MKNRYRIMSTLLFCFSVLMIVIMTVHSFIDYHNYLQHPEYSAPFSVNLMLIGIAYGIPIIIGFVLSVIFKKKIIHQ